MCARRRGEVVGGVVIQDLDIARKARAQERAFHEVVAEQRILGESAFEHAFEHVDFEDALACE